MRIKCSQFSPRSLSAPPPAEYHLPPHACFRTEVAKQFTLRRVPPREARIAPSRDMEPCVLPERGVRGAASVDVSARRKLPCIRAFMAGTPKRCQLRHKPTNGWPMERWRSAVEISMYEQTRRQPVATAAGRLSDARRQTGTDAARELLRWGGGDPGSASKAATYSF